MADRVADDILHGAAQQLRIAADERVARLGELYGAPTALGLEGGVLHDLVHDDDEVDRLVQTARGAALHPRQHQQLADERVETIRLALDAVERGLIVPRALARETERDVQTRQR